MQEIINRFRVDTLKLDEEDFPEVVENGCTCYVVDTMELYIYYKGEWYLQAENEETPADDNTPDTPADDSET